MQHAFLMPILNTFLLVPLSFSLHLQRDGHHSSWINWGNPSLNSILCNCESEDLVPLSHPWYSSPYLPPSHISPSFMIISLYLQIGTGPLIHWGKMKVLPISETILNALLFFSFLWLNISEESPGIPSSRIFSITGFLFIHFSLSFSLPLPPSLPLQKSWG